MTKAFRKILFSTHTKPNYMPPPAYSPDMVICSPHYPTQVDPQGNVISISTPFQREYSLKDIVDGLPEHQKPDLIIARIDAYLGNFPVDVSAIDVPKIAIFGDTHHMQAPLQKLIRYALRQKFDFYILDHNRQHAHWYFEAGLRNIVWIPSLLLAEAFLPPREDTREEIAFVGQVGPIHPMRLRLIEHLQTTDLPLQVQSVPQPQAYQVYNQSRINLNCSLNGDFNLRVFETLAAGGFLLTDQLAPQSGLDTLFEEDKDYITYSSDQEFYDKARHYLAQPQERNSIARSGYKKVSETLNRDARLQIITELLHNGQIDPMFHATADRRVFSYGCNSAADLMFRIQLYEWIQEQHRCYYQVKILSTAGADARIICDCVDLPRLELFCIQGGTGEQLITKAELQSQITLLGAASEQAQKPDWDLLLCDSTDVVSIVAKYQPKALMVTNWLTTPDKEKQLLQSLISKLNLIPHKSTFGLFYRWEEWRNSNY